MYISFFSYTFFSRLPSADGYLSVQLDESKILSAENASGSCLEAKVSYSPVIQRCVWETPDNTRVKCTLQNWVTNNNRYHCTTPCRQRLISANWIFFLIWQICYHGISFWCRTVKFCNPIKSGDYKLHLEAGERKETKTISVCVVGEHIYFDSFLLHKNISRAVERCKNNHPKINITFDKILARCKVYCCPLALF